MDQYGNAMLAMADLAEEVMVVRSIRDLTGTTDTTIRRHIQRGTLAPLGTLQMGPYLSMVFLVDSVVDEWFPDGPNDEQEAILDNMKRSGAYFFSRGRVFRVIDGMLMHNVTPPGEGTEGYILDRSGEPEAQGT